MERSFPGNRGFRGADSIALLRGMARLRPSDSRLIVLHYHHFLRGSESDEDARFVRNLAEDLQCEFRCNWDLQAYPTFFDLHG